jgi:hypothetical protein
MFTTKAEKPAKTPPTDTAAIVLDRGIGSLCAMGG